MVVAYCCVPTLYVNFPSGKHAVAHVLAMGDSVTALLPFVEPWSQREHDHKLKKSSVSSRYAAVLILQLLQSESSCNLELKSILACDSNYLFSGVCTCKYLLLM